MKVTVPRVRVNKRTGASPRSLVPLYHSASHFLPLSPSLIAPHISHAFAPLPAPGSAPSSSLSPSPVSARAVAQSVAQITSQAARYALHLPGTPTPSLRAFDLSTARNDRGSDSIGRAHFDRASDGPTIGESWAMSWRYGDEPPLRRRAREVAERLCGTVAGGKVGEDTVRAKWPEVKEFVDSEKARRVTEVEDEGFGEAFAEEAEAERRA
ncbi:hypothetical protein RQP46_005174 [Phenoliferia psychrophenolica]